MNDNNDHAKSSERSVIVVIASNHGVIRGLDSETATNRSMGEPIVNLRFDPGMTEAKIRRRLDNFLVDELANYKRLFNLIHKISKHNDWVKVFVTSPKADSDNKDISCYFLVRYDHSTRNYLVTSVPDLASALAADTLKDPVESATGAEVQRLASANRERQAADAQAFKTALNNFVVSVPQRTLDEKKKLSQWINEEASLYGLAVECPSNPGVAVLIKGEVGNYPGRGCFQFVPIHGDGTRKKRVTATELPQLNFLSLKNSVDLSYPSSGRGPGQSI